VVDVEVAGAEVATAEVAGVLDLTGLATLAAEDLTVSFSCGHARHTGATLNNMLHMAKRASIRTDLFGDVTGECI
jgi:hypothetical protein